MSRIRQLTDAQRAQIAEYVDRWTKIGLCTDPADRPRAEAAIGDMYLQAGLVPPQTIVWCGSPLSQGLTREIILNPTLMQSIGDRVEAGVMNSVADSVRASMRYSVGAKMGYIMGDSVADKVGGDVGRSVASNLSASVGACSLRDSIGTGIEDSVSDSVWDSVGDRVADRLRVIGWRIGGSYPTLLRVRVEDSVLDSVYGAHDAAWLANCRYFRDVLGLAKETEKLSGQWELAESAGWALPHRHICWVSERHHILERDEHGRLHCLAGPALAYRDGFAIHAVHGVLVPADVIDDPGRIDVARIDRETNVEVRRVMIERYRHGEEVNGPAAFILDAGGERLDHDERFGTLWRRNVPGDEPIAMIEVVNATREPDGGFRRYWLRVPPEVRTAREAVAWTFSMTAQEYAPVKET
jgi:hypothetical protein